jgi:predicted RNA-binding protein
MEEIGSSDISIMVREVYNEVGVDYPENEVAEAKDKVTYDPKTGKLTGWEHEGDWKKQTKKKDPVGKIHRMSDVARRRTEKMTSDETLEEAFERLLSEDTINVGDIIRNKEQPEIQGRVKRIDPDKYIIDVEGDEYHIETLKAEKISKSLHEADSRFMEYLEPLIGQRVYLPAEGKMGTIIGPSLNTNLPTGIQAKLDNGQIITTAPGRFKSTKPGPLQQAIDKFNALTGKIQRVPSVAPNYGKVAGPMDNLHKQDWSNVKEDILKLAGVK